jgi:Flp pilus assembly protein TadD
VGCTVLAPLIVATSILGASVVRADQTQDTPAGASVGAEYALGRQAVEAKDWPRAVELLTRAEVQDDRNPDLVNLLGYAYRHIGRLDEAFKHYEIALRLNPRHRGAREYMGEAYLMVNNLAKAEEQLAALKEICLIPCEEYADLENAIATYRAAHSK